MTLAELKVAAPTLGTMMGHPDRIRLFGWWLHVHNKKTHFQAADIGKCYDELNILRPASFGGYFSNLEGKDLLKNSGGYRLAGAMRDALDALYGQHKQKVAIKEMLRALPGKLPTLAERTYLDEALICYEGGAFRAAVTMTWNLAYAHLCDHILKNRLADFNARWKISFPGMHKKPKDIVQMDDFNDELKEHQVLEICRDADIIVKNVYNVFEPSLKRRNMAAHPNNVSIGQMQTDAYITDLVDNVILKIA